MSSKVCIPEPAFAKMVRAAEAAFPRECCGLLIGSTGGETIVDEIVPTENQAAEASRFLIDPQTQFDWLRRLRGSGRSIVGHYHSHPNGRAQPSDYDAEMASEPGQVWLIIPVEDGTAGAPQAFVSQAGAPKFQTITIVLEG